MENNDVIKIMTKLTELETLQRVTHDDIKEIKKDVKAQNSRVSKLEQCKVDKDEFKPIKKQVYMIAGGITLLGLLIPLIMKFI